MKTGIQRPPDSAPEVRNEEESEMKFFDKRRVSALLCAAALTVTLPLSAFATDSAPLLTEAMSQSSYWSDRAARPRTALADAAELEQLNANSINTRGTGLRDLSVWQETDYNGIEWSSQLREDAMERAYRLYHSYGVRFDGDGQEYSRWTEAAEELYGPMIDNARDTDATEGEHELYAICTTPAFLRSFPSDCGLYQDEGTRDYQKRTQVLLGEPLILKGESDDGAYVYAFSGADSGWLRWTELAVCYSRDEWLRAWQFSAENTLVVYGDGVSTQPSDEDEDGVPLRMGTCLQLAELEDYKRSFRFDTARPDYVVWLPLRSESGWYDARLAVVSRNDEVSEGYLPLTGENLAQVALKLPRNATLRSEGSAPEDCTGYARTVYRCFGLDLSRSISGQSAQPLRQRSLEGMSEAEKSALVKKLPLGSLLCTQDQEYLYLGHEGDTLCIINSVETTDEGSSTGVDSLSSVLPDGTTLLSNLTLAMVPWYNAEARDLTQAQVSGVKDAAYTGKAVTQSPQVTVDGTTLREGVHYTLSYENNESVGEAAVIIKGKGNWKGRLTRGFMIRPAATRLTRVHGTKGGLEAQWKRRSGVKGYQLQYSASEDFSDAVTVKVKGKDSNALRVDNLSRGVWYVRVRSYVRSDGKRYTSAWSDAVQTEVK